MPTCPTCNGRYDQGATFCPKDGTPLLPDGEQEQQTLVGQVIGGRYRLTKLLGRGGMGEVYAGEHVHITKKVAVKLLHPEIGSNQEALVRFRQEAQSASSIGHDNIVAIDDFGQMDDGRVYLCMEFLSGESLNEAMQAPGGLDLARALDVMIQVCDGLAAAHSKGIIHRDMKPENVFITKRSDGSEQIKILDFGIAKVAGTDQNEGLTKTGTVFGTPHYMSPEQALGQKLDHRADVYSVGVMLFEIFTGQVPFKAESFMGILSQHITKPAPSPSTISPGRSIPKAVEDLILKAMAKDPEDRFSSMAEMSAVLQAIRQGTGTARPISAGSTLALGSAPITGPGTPAPSAPITGPGTPAPSAPIPKTMVASEAQVSEIPVVPANYGAPTGRKSKAGLIVGLIVGLVVVLGGGAAAAGYFLWYLPAQRAVETTDTVTDSVSAGKTVAQADKKGGPPAVAPDAGAAKVALASDNTTEVPDRPPEDSPPADPTPKDSPPADPAPEDSPPADPAPEDSPAGSTKPKPRPKVTAKPRPQVTPKPRPRPVALKPFVEVTIVTVPAGKARLRQDGRRTLGYTPTTLKMKRGQQLRILVARGGFADKWITVVGDGDKTVRVQLRRQSWGAPD